LRLLLCTPFSSGHVWQATKQAVTLRASEFSSCGDQQDSRGWIYAKGEPKPLS
jgi:hypothetical protein